MSQGSGNPGNNPPRQRKSRPSHARQRPKAHQRAPPRPSIGAVAARWWAFGALSAYFRASALSRICLSATESVMNATMRIVDLHLGHSSGSSS